MACFSLLSPTPIEVEGTVFASPEHFLQVQHACVVMRYMMKGHRVNFGGWPQSARFKDVGIQRKIQAAATPGDARELGDRYSRQQRKDWQAVAVDCLRVAILSVYCSHADLGAKLVAASAADVRKAAEAAGPWAVFAKDVAQVLNEIRESMRSTTTDADTKMAAEAPCHSSNFRHIVGDLLSAPEQAIVHQCHCEMTNGAKGLAAVIFKACPWSNVYVGGVAHKSTTRIPGGASVHGDPAADQRLVINLYGQRHPGQPGGVTKAGQRIESREQRYAWFLECLRSLHELCGAHGISSLAFPFQIGCGLAGGDWAQYEAAIIKFAAAHPDMRVTVYQLPE